MIRAPWVLICQEAQSNGSASCRSFPHRRGSTSWDPGNGHQVSAAVWSPEKPCCAAVLAVSVSACWSSCSVRRDFLLSRGFNFGIVHVFSNSAAVEQNTSRHAESCAPNPPAHLDPQHGLLETGMVRTGAHVRERLHLFYMPPRSQHLSGRVMHAYILGEHEDARSLVLSQKSGGNQML